MDDVVSLLRVSASVSYMDRRHLHGPAGLLGKHDIILTILVVEHSQREGHLHVLQLEFLSVFSRLPEIQGGVRDALSPSITIRNVRNVKSTPMCWSLDRPNVQTFIQLDFTNIVKEYSSVSPKRTRSAHHMVQQAVPNIHTVDKPVEVHIAP